MMVGRTTVEGVGGFLHEGSHLFTRIKSAAEGLFKLLATVVIYIYIVNRCVLDRGYLTTYKVRYTHTRVLYILMTSIEL